MTRLSKRQTALVLAALFLSISMMGIVPIVTRALGPLPGYLCVFAIYWSCFCAPAALIFGKGDLRVGLGWHVQPFWTPALAIALPIGVFFGAQTLGSTGADPTDTKNGP